jgi:hypothetical protein
MYEVNSIYTYKRLVTAKVNRCHLMTCVWLLGAINHTCCVVGRGRSRERRASLGGWATAHRPDGRLAGGWNWMSPAGTLADAAAAADRFQIRSRNGTRPAGRRPRSSSTRPIRLHPSIHPRVRTPSATDTCTHAPLQVIVPYCKAAICLIRMRFSTNCTSGVQMTRSLGPTVLHVFIDRTRDHSRCVHTSCLPIPSSSFRSLPLLGSSSTLSGLSVLPGVVSVPVINNLTRSQMA